MKTKDLEIEMSELNEMVEENLQSSNCEKYEKDERTCIRKSRIAVGLVAVATAATDASTN